MFDGWPGNFLGVNLVESDEENEEVGGAFLMMELKGRV